VSLIVFVDQADSKPVLAIFVGSEADFTWSGLFSAIEFPAGSSVLWNEKSDFAVNILFIFDADRNAKSSGSSEEGTERLAIWSRWWVRALGRLPCPALVNIRLIKIVLRIRSDVDAAGDAESLQC